MFTGIVEATSTVLEVGRGRMSVKVPKNWEADPLVLGESVAVDGCCLTVTQADTVMQFDLSEETLRRTTLGLVQEGKTVNLERALKLGDRLGGHFVQGHIDKVGYIVATAPNDGGLTLRIDAGSPELLVDKGSVTVDGVSLTVVEPREGQFEVWLIPETLSRTTLGGRAIGDPVNIEFDVLAKHIAHLAAGILGRWAPEPPAV